MTITMDELVADVAAVYRRGETDSFGSGRLIAPGLVLTARHIVDLPIEKAAGQDGWKVSLLRNRKRDGSWSAGAERTAEVIWRGLHDLDLALLKVRDRIESGLAPRAPALQPVFSTHVLPGPIEDLGAVGFPKSALAEGARLREYSVFGTLRLAGLRRYVWSVAAADKPDDPRGWKGMSGAAVFLLGPDGRLFLFGAVQEVPANFSGGQLDVARLSAAFEDEAFLSQLRSALGEEPRIVPYKPANAGNGSRLPANVLAKSLGTELEAQPQAMQVVQPFARSGPVYESFGRHFEVAATPPGDDPPTYDLSSLYTEPAWPKIEADLDKNDRECLRFAKRYRERLADSTGPELLKAIRALERIGDGLDRPMSYAQLRYYEDTSNVEAALLLEKVTSRTFAATEHLTFFYVEISQLDEAVFLKKLGKSKALMRFKPYFDLLRATKNYTLAEEEECRLHRSGMEAARLCRSFDQKVAQLRFTIGQDIFEREDAFTWLWDQDRSFRMRVAAEISRVYETNVPDFASIYSELIKIKADEDELRRVPGPTYFRHLANQIDPSLVDALEEAVVRGYPRTSFRYYELKRQWMGLGRLDYWDRNAAPFPGSPSPSRSWSDARDLVLGVFNDFSPRAGAAAHRFFKEGWINAAHRPGKAAGAFEYPASANPFIHLWFNGSDSTTLTLASMLGHGVHHLLAGRQGYLLSQSSMLVTTIVSVFFETLAFWRIMESADESDRRWLRADFVENRLNSIVRQISYYRFEKRVHAEWRLRRALTAEEIGLIWMETQAESVGPAFRLTSGYRHHWLHVPNFVHSPFGVYAHAFGGLAATTLFAHYLRAEGDERTDFQSRFLAMLEAGGSRRPDALLASFGLDASKAGFWERGLAVLEGMIGELETTGVNGSGAPALSLVQTH